MMLRNIFGIISNSRLKQKDFLIKRTVTGELRITHEAIEDIIQRSIADIGGLKRLRLLIKQNTKGLEISVFSQIDDGNDISQVSGKVQEKVCQDVEQYSGIIVKEVKVLVQPLKFSWHPVSK